MYNRHVSDLQNDGRQMELANVGLTRERDYWRAGDEKAQATIHAANQQTTNREAELRHFELANRNQQQTMNMTNSRIAELYDEMLKEQQKNHHPTSMHGGPLKAIR